MPPGLITNPYSAKQLRAGKHGEALATLGEIEERATERAGHAAELATELGRTCSPLIAAGGDGTIHEVINGLMQLPRDERPPLGIIPLGTGNDTIKPLAIPKKIGPAIDVIRAGKTTSIDIGKMNGTWFAVGLGTGLDAEVADRVDRARKKNPHKRGGGFGVYQRASVASVLRYRGIELELNWTDQDGNEDSTAGTFLMVTIGNGTTFGGGFRLCPDASMTDGLLDLVMVRHIGKLRVLSLMPKAKKGKHMSHKKVTHHKVRSVRISGPAYKVHVDGEMYHERPLEVSLEPGALDVIVP